MKKDGLDWGVRRPLSETSEIVSIQKTMQKNTSIKIKLAGTERSVGIIANLLADDAEIQSGLFGLNNDLEIINIVTFGCKLKHCSINNVFNNLSNNVTAIVMFDVFSCEPFTISETFVRTMASGCESIQISLLDIICYSRQRWASLRQQNLL